MPVIVPATSSTSDTSSADRSASDANKRDDENTPSEVLHAAPTQEVRVAATAEDDYYHDLSTLSETIDECDSKFCAGTVPATCSNRLAKPSVISLFSLVVTVSKGAVLEARLIRARQRPREASNVYLLAVAQPIPTVQMV